MREWVLLFTETQISWAHLPGLVGTKILKKFYIKFRQIGWLSQAMISCTSCHLIFISELFPEFQLLFFFFLRGIRSENSGFAQTAPLLFL